MSKIKKICNVILLIAVYLTMALDVTLTIINLVLSLFIGFGTPSIVIFIALGVTFISLIKTKKLLKGEL